ncbi:MAG: hypothetical protein MR635_06645 [Mollicutes bacterium]|nr:hypothetical protein [Mollicutes bacterium]
MNLHTRRDPQPKTGIDCSNPRRRQFVEVQPFAVDPDTGEILNPTGQLVLKEVAPINQDEVIQSYFETSDFKTILNRIRKGSGEEIPTYDGTGSFIDLSNMPKNIMELDRYLKEKKNKTVSPVPASDSVPADVSSSDKELDEKIKTYLDRKFAAAAAPASTLASVVEENKEENK